MLPCKNVKTYRAVTDLTFGVCIGLLIILHDNGRLLSSLELGRKIIKMSSMMLKLLILWMGWTSFCILIWCDVQSHWYCSYHSGLISNVLRFPTIRVRYFKKFWVRKQDDNFTRITVTWYCVTLWSHLYLWFLDKDCWVAPDRWTSFRSTLIVPVRLDSVILKVWNQN